MKILVTGCAGFIGFHLCKHLLENKDVDLVGIDNLNKYYDPNLKLARLHELGIEIKGLKSCANAKFRHNNFKFINLDISNQEELFNLYKNENFEYIFHLAAQAGVRYSIEEPNVYISSNIVGFHNVLEACKYFPVKRLFYASSSSVYGNNLKMPLSESNEVNNPVSLYAATKRSNEIMAFTYHNLYKITSVGLRFFTVYGPWGRPDMAIYKFTDCIINNKPIEVYNNGNLYRDFTYIDDIISGIDGIFEKSKNDQTVTADLFNIGSNNPISLLDFIEILENVIGKKAAKIFVEMQSGDVNTTYADISKIRSYSNFNPTTSLQDGVKKFYDWYNSYLVYSL
jgi:UDP-glucuronate 4-epimerase